MLTEMNYWDMVREKMKNQSTVPDLEYHASGHCVHIGKISPGCRQCFTGEPGGGVQIGNLCMCNCPMCYYPRDRVEMTKEETNDIITSQYFLGLMDQKPISISYQSSGETLSYLEDLEKVAKIHQDNEKRLGIQTYHHLYTNGILATTPVLNKLMNMGVHEIRYHISASNFSLKVINSMYEAASMGFSVTVEEPSWPKHRDKLLQLLEVFEDIGVIHLDIVEIQLTPHNFNELSNQINGRYFKDYFYQMYDEGMVYDIMREVKSKQYHYSVIDCNSGVERCRHGKYQHIGFHMDSIDGMCDDFPYSIPKTNQKWFYNKNKNRLQRLTNK